MIRIELLVNPNCVPITIKGFTEYLCSEHFCCCPAYLSIIKKMTYHSYKCLLALRQSKMSP